MPSPNGIQINWLDSSCRSLQIHIPESAEYAAYITARLSELLLSRLPRELAADLLSLLPEEPLSPARIDFGSIRTLHMARSKPGSPRAGADRSIGHTDFVGLTRHLLGLTELLDTPQYAESEEAYAKLCEQVTAAFLWAVAQELPIELKERMAEHLPADLRCRMNLYSGYSSTDKVA